MDIDTKIELKADVEKTSNHIISPFLNKETVVYYFSFTVILLSLVFCSLITSLSSLEIRSDIKDINNKTNLIFENNAYFKAEMETNKRDIKTILNNITEIRLNINEHEKRILKIESNRK